MSLPEQALPFIAAAVAAYGPLVLTQAAQASTDTPEALGRELLRLAFGRQEPGAEIPPQLAAFAADPADEQAQFELEDLVDEALRDQPASQAAAAGMLAGFYRGQAAAGDIQALISLGDLLRGQDDLDGARAAYQQAVDAGHEHALIDLAVYLRGFAGDTDAAVSCLRRAAGSADPGVAAEATTELADLLWSRGDIDGGRAAYQAAIEGGHPEWAPQAMLRLGHKLTMRRDFPDARAVFQRAVGSGHPHVAADARFALGKVLQREGDDDGAMAAWQQLIDGGEPGWAGPALTEQLNLLRHRDDLDGVRALGRAASEAGNPQAPYALVIAGHILHERGNAEGARAAYQQAVDAGSDDAGYLRETLAELDETAAELDGTAGADDDDLADLPSRFRPGNIIRTGLEVLERGLPPLPEELSYQMAIPVAWWTAGPCAVVLSLRFRRLGAGPRFPILLQASYARTDAGWTPNRYVGGSGFSHDPIASPGDQRDLDGQLIVGGQSTYYRELPPPGYPAAIVSGRAAPEVARIALIQDGREDRRPLESHFGAWVVCTERQGPFQVAALDAVGTTLAILRYSFDALPCLPRNPAP